MPADVIIEEEDYDDIEDCFDDGFGFDLYETLDSDEAARQGGLKTYHVKEGGSAIYSEKKSDYKIIVERLIWADGWEDGSKPEAERQAMTLVVLKMVFASTDSDSRFRHINATIEFEDETASGAKEPEIEAWAPFHTLERSNESEAEIKDSTTADARLEAGAYGVKGSTGIGNTKEISWKQSSFDEGHATSETSKKTGRRNGVNWFMKQNALQNHGVTPELWTAVLLSRKSNDPYFVRFHVNVHAGTTHEIMNKIKKWFGLGPGQTKKFKVTPSETPTVNHEGKDIIGSIDLNNLGSLRNRGDMAKLVLAWSAEQDSAPKEADNKASSTTV